MAGVYVVRPAHAWTNCSGGIGGLLDTVNLMQIRQTGNRLTGTGLAFNETYTGYMEGDIFVLMTGDGAATGAVETADGTGEVEGLFGSSRWSLDSCWGWSGLDAQKSSGASGVPNVPNLVWNLNIESPRWGNFYITANVTTSGNNITIKLNDVPPDNVDITVRGKIYDTLADRNTGNFVAKNNDLILFGKGNETSCSGTYVSADGDAGTFVYTIPP
jgi:hypothetical protein